MRITLGFHVVATLATAVLLVVQKTTAIKVPASSAVDSSDEHNHHHRDLIVGGTAAASGKYLSFASNLGGCGATLIHPDIALSSANCSSSFPNGSSIYIGGVKRDGSDAEKQIVDYVIVHPDYDPPNTDYRNDIMIIKLKNNSTSPIQALSNNDPAVNAKLTTIGYGNTAFGVGYSGDLLQVTVTAFDDNDCFNTYDKFGLYYSTLRMLCAGSNSGGKDSCQGDRGGPIYDTNLRQVGISSFGNGCGLAAFPGVYTRVSTFTTWINQMICSHSSNPGAACILTIIGSLCLSGSNIVEVKDVGHIRLSQLQIGDYVRAGNGDYSQVYSFGHYDNDLETVFIQIYLEGQTQQTNVQPLEITSNHLLFVRRGSNRNQVIPASEIVVGDILSDGQKVESIRYVRRQGTYAPLTQSGDIIVSGIRASSYVNVLHENKWLMWDQHVLGHAYFYPRRLFCKYNIDACQKESYTYGYSLWAYIVIRFASIMKAWGFVGSITVSFLSVLLVGSVYVIELMTIMPFFSLIAISAMIYSLIRRQNNRKQDK